MRRVLTNTLIVLAAVVLIAGMVAVWADELLLSPGKWETTSTQLLANPTVRTSTANYLAGQIEARLQLAHIPSSALGPELGPIAGTSVASTQAAISHAMYYALGLPTVQTLWSQANRSAATALVNVVNSPSGGSATGGPVTVSLGPILRAAAKTAQLPSAIVAALPANAGTLTVLQSDHFHAVQTAGRAVRDLARDLVIAVIVLWLAALALARYRRRRTLAWIGASAVLAGVLVLAARALLVTPVADTISADPSLRSVIGAAITAITASLGHLAVLVGVVGFVVAVVGAGLAGLNTRPRQR